jgi:hypothetical protein
VVAGAAEPGPPTDVRPSAGLGAAPVHYFLSSVPAKKKHKKASGKKLNIFFISSNNLIKAQKKKQRGISQIGKTAREKCEFQRLIARTFSRQNSNI